LSDSIGIDPLLIVIRDPATVKCLSKSEWQTLLSRARENGLLPSLRRLFDERDLLTHIPEKVQLQLDEARIFLRFNQTKLRFEANRVERVLSELDADFVVLKGGAYLLADLPPAHRRVVSDLDIMVDRTNLETAENALVAAGWQRSDVTEYDERYYRIWMHEIPPMAHPDRGFALDLHHSIVPMTSRHQPDTIAPSISSTKKLVSGCAISWTCTIF
jgi:hypothetical protein